MATFSKKLKSEVYPNHSDLFSDTQGYINSLKNIKHTSEMTLSDVFSSTQIFELEEARYTIPERTSQHVNPQTHNNKLYLHNIGTPDQFNRPSSELSTPQRRYVRESLYDILRISASASLREIQRAYKALALTAHPDKGGDTIRFQKISQAYNILSNQE
jgi:hypothetical protein